MATLSSEGISNLVCSKPIPLDLPEDVLIERLIEDLRVEDCNEVNARMYGYESAAAMAGVRARDFAPLVPMNIDHIRRFVRAGFGMTEGEVRNIDSQGREKYCIVNVTGVVEGNALQRVWRFARDITERKQAELDLAKANKKLRQIIASS
jgi:PAS domain S-box-containing protein